MPSAIKTSDLPFNRQGMSACAAPRVGNVTMKVPGIPIDFQVRFIGTGTAVLPIDTKNVFDVNHAQSSVEMVWYQNKFVGRHWLLGEFEINLAEDKQSVGTIQVMEKSDFGPNTVNSNKFYFDFVFKRFPFLNMRNITPIENSAVVSDVPPVGSVFKLSKQSDMGYLFKTGVNRLVDSESVPNRVLEFKQCDIVVFPEQNVELSLVEQTQQDDSYTVIVEICNPTSQEATFAYFSVIHFTGITTDNDYGFVLLKSGEKAIIRYKVISSISGRNIELPFFAALYEPSTLQGAKFLKLDFEF